jgi:hypothetical protein
MSTCELFWDAFYDYMCVFVAFSVYCKHAFVCPLYPYMHAPTLCTLRLANHVPWLDESSSCFALVADQRCFLSCNTCANHTTE